MVSNCIFTVWVPFSRKICGVSRGVKSLGSGFPIGARSIPVGTRFCLQSLVCYTFCDRWRWKGAVTLPDRQFPEAAEQADFVGCKLQKTRNLQWAKSDCSYVVVIENLEAVRRDLLWQRGRKRYIKPAAAISSRIVFAPFPIQRESSISSEVRSWRVSEFDGLQF